MIPFGVVVYLTFSRAAAASSVLGISVTTCLAKFLICISTRFELLRIPIALLTLLIIPFQTLTTDLTRLFTSSDRSPPFSSSRAALTSLEVWCLLSLIIVLSLILLATWDFWPQKVLLNRGRQLDALDTRLVLKDIVRLPNPLLLVPTSSSSG